MINFIEKMITAACCVFLIETAHAMGYIRGAWDAANIDKEKEESKDHE